MSIYIYTHLVGWSNPKVAPVCPLLGPQYHHVPSPRVHVFKASAVRQLLRRPSFIKMDDCWGYHWGSPIPGNL